MVGFGFAMPGYAKLANGPDHFIDNLRALGVPVLELMGWMTIII